MAPLASLEVGLASAAMTQGSRVELVGTADVGGSLGVCGSCPAQGTQGGAARWRSAAAKAGATGDALWLDAGGFLFGGGDPARVAEVYAGIAFDAVHVVPVDFRLGLAFTRDLLREAGLPATSANLLDESGAAIFAPFIVADADGAPLAVVGVSEPSAALAYLPSLAAQLKGITIADPIETLERVLPEAEAAADRVVLLVHGSAQFAGQIRERFGARVMAIVCGGMRPGQLAALGPTTAKPEQPPFLAVEAGGIELAFLGDGAAAAERVAVRDGDNGELAFDPLIVGLLEAQESHPTNETKDAAGPTAAEKRQASGAPGDGRGLRLVTGPPMFQDKLGETAPGSGQRWVTFDVEVENDLSLDVAFGGQRELGERMLVALKQNLFLVSASASDEPYRALPVAELKSVAGALPLSFELTSIGSAGRGTVAFAWPANESLPSGETGTLALWLDHDEFPPAIATLQGTLTPADALPASEPGASSNGYVTLHGATLREARPQGAAAPGENQRWVEVTLSGSSVWTPFEGRTKPATYLRAQEHLQLIIDGQWPYLRALGSGSLGETPVFLPGVTSGGSAFFLIPTQTQHLALALHFPRLGGTDLNTPAPLIIDLEGTSLDSVPETALAVVNDEPISMAVISALRRDLAPSSGDAEGPAEVELDLRFMNGGHEGGQLKLAKRFLGEGYRFLGAFDSVGIPLTDAPVLPPGSRRAVRVRLGVPADALADGALQMGYSGITVNPQLSLRLGASGELELGEPAVPLDATEDQAVEIASGGATPKWAAPIPVAPKGEPEEEADDTATNTVKELSLVQPLPAASNDAVTLTIESARIAAERPGFTIPAGEELLILATRWRLEQPPVVGEKHQIEPYKVLQKSQLHLVVDGRRLAPTVQGPDGFLAKVIEVPSRSDRQAFLAARRKDESVAPPQELRGELAFAIPSGSEESLSLHLLDPQHGRLVVPFFGTDVPLDSHAAPYPAAENRVGRIRVRGVDVEPPKTGRRMATVTVDLRGTSFCRAEPLDFAGRSEPIAHEFQGAKAGAIYLLFDGEYPVPTGANDLRTRFLWLPDAEVGGLFHFKVPFDVLGAARRVELVVCPGDTAMPGEMIHGPAALVVPLLAGDLANDEDMAATWRVKDGSIEVLGRRAPRLAESTKPNDYELRLQIKNVGSTRVQLDLTKLLSVESEDGSIVGPKTDQRPTIPRPFNAYQELFIPPGARRTVDILYRPRNAPKVLHYSGLLRESVLALDERGQPPKPAPLPTVDGVAIIDRTRALGGIESVGLRGQEVNQAVDRGRDWVLSEIAEKFETQGAFRFTEGDALTMLALVHARAHEEFPEFAEQLQVYLGTQRPSTFTRQGTYRCGVLAMLLDALDDPAHHELLRDVATYLVNAQQDDGTWPYHVELPEWLYRLEPLAEEASDVSAGEGPLRLVGRAVSRADSQRRSDAVKEHKDGVAAGALTMSLRRRVPWTSQSNGDNSLAQYALLGLHACENQGISIDREVWTRTLRNTWNRQGTTGGWAYTTGRSYGSMTCAGATLVALAMRALERERDPLLDRRLYRACAWLARAWQVKLNPQEGAGWNKHIFYYYYGAERSARLLDTEVYGPHEWYPLLARKLVDNQSEGGAWPASAGENTGLTTAFAILVLTRATETLDPVARQEQRAARDARRPKTGKLEMNVVVQKARGAVLVLDASGSMLAPPADATAGNRTAKFEYARDALLGVVERLPEGAPTGLVVYGHRKRARDDGANTDVEMVIPVGPLNRSKFIAALQGLTARGKTPIALALKESLSAFKSARVRAGTVVLLTDGGQGREPGDPVAAAEAIGRAGYRLEIVAFDMDGARSKSMAIWNQQIEAMAQGAGGRWVSVGDGERLAPTVIAAATGEPGLCEVSSSSGEVAYSGPFEGSVELEPGAYVLRASYGDEAFDVELTIERGRATRVEFDASRVALR